MLLALALAVQVAAEVPRRVYRADGPPSKATRAAIPTAMCMWERYPAGARTWWSACVAGSATARFTRR